MEKSGTHDMEDESWFWLKGDSLLAIVAGRYELLLSLLFTKPQSLRNG